MGYSYCAGYLCCDFCDRYGPGREVRRMKCPYDWCQPWATCADCRKLKKHHVSSAGGPGTHREICKPASEQFAAELEAESVTEKICGCGTTGACAD